MSTQPVDTTGDTPAPPPRWMAYMPLDDLQPAKRNVKEHDEAVIEHGISKYGLIDNVVLDERTGLLVGGHGRRKDALRRRGAGEDPPDGVVVRDGVWMLPVQRGWASRSDDEAAAAGVILNEATIKGGQDTAALVELLTELQATDQLADAGFTDAELDDLMAGLGDELLLPPGDTDAAHAEQTPRGAPATPREVQGLREVALMFSSDDYRTYGEHMARLKNAWGTDVASQVVLRALAEAAQP